MSIKIEKAPLNGRSLQEILDYALDLARDEMKIKRLPFTVEHLEKDGEFSRPDEQTYHLLTYELDYVWHSWECQIVISRLRNHFSIYVSWEDEWEGYFD